MLWLFKNYIYNLWNISIHFLMCCTAVILERNPLWLRMFKRRLIKTQEINNSKGSENTFLRNWQCTLNTLSPNRQQNCWETWLDSCLERGSDQPSCPEKEIHSPTYWAAYVMQYTSSFQLLWALTQAEIGFCPDSCLWVIHISASSHSPL